MIVKSKVRPFHYWLSLITACGAAGLIFYFVLFGFDWSMKKSLGAHIFYYSFLILTILVCGGNIYTANIISINTQLKTIEFKNRVTRKVSIYNFSEFNGKLTSFEPIASETAKIIFLIKGRKSIKKISSLFYSNHKEIESCLREIPDIGKFGYYSLKTWKIKLGLPIIK